MFGTAEAAAAEAMLFEENAAATAALAKCAAAETCEVHNKVLIS